MIDVLLAPMAGLTTSPVRRFMKKMGAGLVFTEMISIESLVRKNPNSISLLKYENEEKPIGAQVFGNEIKYFIEGAKTVKDLGFDLLDINCGCPAKKIVKNNNGVMLMNSPELIGRIIAEIKENVDLPVSIKIRLGIKDNDNLIFSFLEKIKNAPVDLITAHIRYAENFHKGEPDLEIAKKIRDYIKVKYIVNGGITTVEKAGEVLEKTNCDGIMIGRPAFSNLLLIKQIANFFNQQNNTADKHSDDTTDENYSVLMKNFFQGIAEEKHLGKLKQMVPYVIKNNYGSKELRIKLFSSKTIEEFLEIIRGRSQFVSLAGRK